MRVLVLNSGSSSLKFALIDLSQAASTANSTNRHFPAPLSEGNAECLSSPEARLSCKINGNKESIEIPNAKHGKALETIVTVLKDKGILTRDPDAIGHRVVAGGEKFTQPTLITPEIIDEIETLTYLAPLHNPSAVLGLRIASQLYPDTPQVAVFDTAFHQTLPEHAYLYAIPKELYHEHSLRRYGAHGTSHCYVAQQAARQLGFPLESSRILTAHLGNGCSATAVLNGKSVDTSMGLTPLEGLVMGTRSGDVDPGLILFLAEQLEMTAPQISDLLNKKSGLLGISGISNDMRTLAKKATAGSSDAQLALDIFSYRAAKTLASLSVATQGIDTLVFTGGIGENNASMRASICSHLSHLGLMIDPERNACSGKHSNGIITTESSPAQAVVIPTNEEGMIASLTQSTLTQR